MANLFFTFNLRADVVRRATFRIRLFIHSLGEIYE